MKTNTDKPAGGHRRRASGQYIVGSDRLELPRGSHFVTLPVPVEAGQLAAILVGEELMIIGRWYPGVAGCNRIVMPGLLIEDTGEVPVRVLGRVVVVDVEVKQVTDLPESEYERFFENPFPRSLDS